MTTFKFTYDSYRNLIDEILEAGLDPQFYDEAVDETTILLRHDVDWSPRKARKIGEIEAQAGVQSTFFFLLTSPFYNALSSNVRSVFDDLLSMDHRIGLHFSTHQYWSDNPKGKEIEDKVHEELKIMEEITGERNVPVSFHNPPDWILRRDFEGFRNTYEPIFFDRIAYRADSNQRWRDEPPFENDIPHPLQVLTHPVLWGKRDAFATDRLREERDFNQRTIVNHLEITDRTWEGPWGVCDEQMTDN